MRLIQVLIYELVVSQIRLYGVDEYVSEWTLAP